MAYGFIEGNKGRIEVLTKEEYQSCSWTQIAPVGYLDEVDNFNCISPIEYMISGNMLTIRGAVVAMRATDMLVITLPDMFKDLVLNYCFPIYGGMITIDSNCNLAIFAVDKTVDLNRRQRFCFSVPIEKINE